MTRSTATAPPDTLRRLCQRRWAIPVLAALARRRSGMRHVELVASLGVARGLLRLTLDELQAAGIVMRHPGYGHPLRPEYVLTSRGAALAVSCLQLHRLAVEMELTDLLYRKWTLPVLREIGSDGRHFGDLQRALASITPRALTQALRGAESAGLLCRGMVAGRPVYRLSQRGAALTSAATAIAETA